MKTIKISINSDLSPTSLCFAQEELQEKHGLKADHLIVHTQWDKADETWRMSHYSAARWASIEAITRAHANVIRKICKADRLTLICDETFDVDEWHLAGPDFVFISEGA